MTTANAGLSAASVHASASTVTGEFWAPMHGLRGLAVVYVLVSHLGNLGLSLVPVPHDRIGKVGVWIFFGLSAFLLTRRLRTELANSSNRLRAVAAYFVHRLFRIYPLFFVVLLIHVAVRDFPLSDVSDHLLLRAGHEELWAIPVEFKYYFVIPCIALASLMEKRPRYMLILVVATLLVSQAAGIAAPDRVFSNELGVLPKAAPFLLGSLLALLFDPAAHDPDSGTRRRWALVASASLIGLLAATVAFRALEASLLPPHLAPWISLTIGLSVMGLMRCAFADGVLSRVLRSAPLVFLGEISFSVYLLHLFVIRRVMDLGLPSPVATAWLAVFVVLACATASYVLIERPGMRIGKIAGRAIV